MKQDQKYISVRQAAEFLGLSRWTIYSLVSERRIPHNKVGSRVLFDPVELNKWMLKRRVPCQVS